MARFAAFLAIWGLMTIPLVAAPQSKTDDDEPLVFTNADLPPPLPTSGPTTPAPDTPPPGATTGMSYAEARDRNGHGEGWWRRRAAELDLAVALAWREAQTLHVQFVRGKEITDPTLKLRSREATLAYKELEAERERLPEELRQAGGMPGWLRRGADPFPVEDLGAPTGLELIRGELPTLSWQAPAQASYYLVELQCLDCCGLLGPCDMQSIDVAATQLPYEVEADKTLRWRVLSMDSAGFPGDWSEWVTSAPRDSGSASP